MSGEAVEIVNRTDTDFNFMHGGVPYKVPKNGSIHVDSTTAAHARKKSIMMYDLETGKATYQIGTKGVHDVSPLGKGKTEEDELIDRDTDPEIGAKKVNVRGSRAAIREGEDALVR